MIEFINESTEEPFVIFKKKYDQAFNAKQDNIEAISISSYDKKANEVDARFVNVKFVENDNFIFFSNYNSPKSYSFKYHNQIGATFFWSATNTQIRMRAKIKKTSVDFNNEYFKERCLNKNAIAICSNQSKTIASYDEVVANYNHTIKNTNLKKCPSYWGGFSFVPYYFEFWQGHKSRINKREAFKLIDKNWNQTILQP